MHAAGRGLDRVRSASSLRGSVFAGVVIGLIVPVDLAVSAARCLPGRRWPIGQVAVLDGLAGLAAGGLLGYLAWRMQKHKIARRFELGAAVRGSVSRLAGGLHAGNIHDIACFDRQDDPQNAEKTKANCHFPFGFIRPLSVDIGLVADCRVDEMVMSCRTGFM